MIGFTVSEVARVTGGTLHGGGGGRPVAGAVRDHREVRPGLMFCALAGARHDGHDFIADALARGAPCALARRVPAGVAGPVVVVPEVEAAMRRLAAACRERLAIPVVGVTGSSGKTTTKELVAAVLGQRFDTLRTEGNLNNALGVPLTLFRAGPAHGAAVVELGISGFGEMRVLGRMARPDIAVYTMIGRSHLEALGDLDGVLRAKAELLDEMPAGGLVVANGDDARLAGLRCRQRRLLYGLGPGCDVRAEELAPLGEAGSRFTVVAGARRIPARVPAYGRQLVYAALAAAAVGLELGLTDAEIAAGLAAYAPVGRRARVLRAGGLLLIDDCYNANPDSVAMAIASAGDLPGRFVCILGDMLELGAESEAMHRETGRAALDAGALLLTTGARARDMGGHWFPDKAALIAALPEYLRPGDKVLVKASHALGFEEVSQAVLAGTWGQ